MIENIVKAMAQLNEDILYYEVKKAVDAGADKLEIILSLQEGMNIIYSQNYNFLFERMMSADLFLECHKIIQKSSEKTEAKYGVFILGTVYGDIHSIGKNIVSAVFGCNGFKVVDLGIDVQPEIFIEAIKKHDPKVVGLSCLLTNAFDALKDCVESIRKTGLDEGRLLLIGGGSIDRETFEYADADDFASNPFEGVFKAQQFLSKLYGSHNSAV